jgi:hypothetical protein
MHNFVADWRFRGRLAPMHAPMPDTALSASRWAMVGRIRLCLCGVSAVVGMLSMPIRHLGDGQRSPRRDKRICPRLRPARPSDYGGGICLYRPGRLASAHAHRMAWRTKVPVVEAHIPAATAVRRIARSPTRSNQSLVQGLRIPKATASS